MISEPAAARVFVGREAELARIAETFARGARSIAIGGPPGAGKTRLAARLVDLEAADLHAGLVVDLAGTRSDEALVAELASALDLRADAGPPPDRSRVAAAIAAWCPRLVVLDHAEDLDDRARSLLAAILDGLPRGGRVVVTSRERGAVLTDGSLELDGLRVDDDGEATTLFRERARAAGVTLDDGDLPVVRAIVRAVDGNPLAIELAASQLDVLSPAEVRARLARRLDLSADRGSGARFPTLRAAIAASWESLDDVARRVLAVTSIFAGELSADAAEAVVGDASIDVVAALRLLRDRSLVAVRRAGPDQGTGKNRLRVDASVRLFAREQLDASGDRASVAARHAAWFVGRAGAMSAALRRRGDREARAWLLDEQDELVAIARGDDAPRALAAALALAPLWQRTGRCIELCDVLDAAIARGAQPDADGALAAANARALAWGSRGRLAEARGVLADALEAAGCDCASDLVGEALTHLMVRHRQLGDVEAAITAGERADALLDETSAPHVAAANAACLGLTLAEIGQVAEARRFDERARAAFRDLGDRWGEGLVLGNLAQLAQGEGDLDAAVYFADDAIDAFREGRDPLYEGIYRGVRAGIAREAGSFEEAREGYDVAVERLAAGGARHVEGIFRAQRAGLLAEMGELDAARAEIDRAGVALRAAGAPAYLALLELHAREVELFRARGTGPGFARGGAATAEKILAAEGAARATLEAASELPAARRSQFVTFAARVVARAVAPPPDTDRRVMWLGAEAAWVQVPPGEPVTLVRRVAPRRILGALVAAQRSATSAALGVDALFAAGWPGERAIASARANRVRVAIATLRALGLEGLLVTRDAGYALTPDVVVRDDPRSAP